MGGPGVGERRHVRARPLQGAPLGLTPSLVPTVSWQGPPGRLVTAHPCDVHTLGACWMLLVLFPQAPVPRSQGLRAGPPPPVVVGSPRTHLTAGMQLG